MPALTVVITGNAKKLEAEMLKIQALAKRTGQNIQTSMNGATPGGGGGGEGGHLKSGVLREAMVLVREISRGDFKRAASSLSILLQRLDLLSLRLIMLVGVAAAFAAALWGLDKMFKALAPKEDTLGIKSLSGAFDKFKRAAMDSKAAAKAFFDELKRGRTEVEKLQDAMQDSKSTTDAWTKSDERKADAQKELALAQIEHDKATGKISAKEAAKLKADVENKAEEEKFKRQKEARDKNVKEMYAAADKAEAEHNKAKDEVGAKSEAATRAAQLRDENEERMGRLKETIKGLEKEHSEAIKNGDGLQQLRSGNAMRYYQSLYDFAAQNHPELVTDAKQKDSDLQRAQNDAAGLKKEAENLRRNASRQIVQNTAEDSADKAQLEADRARRALELESNSKAKVVHGETNSLQKVGAYTSPATVALIDVSKKSEGHLRALKEHFLKHGTSGGHGMEGVKY